MCAVRISRLELENAAQCYKVLSIGDAAHIMPIFAGEGDNHELLDAVELIDMVVRMTESMNDGQGEGVADIEELHSTLVIEYRLRNTRRWGRGVKDSIAMLHGLFKSMNDLELIAEKTHAT